MHRPANMLRSVLGKSFSAGKCKTLLRLAISRIKLLKNKRDMQLKQMRRDLGQLLQSKQELTARIRVEHVFREQNILAAYEIIELFSELLVVRLPIIESQRQCPIDLREAIASLIFAAPRCADLPELQDISSLFAVKYGKDFVAAAAELRPDCGVNRLVIEKLSVRAPSDEVRLKLMKEIAEEQGVDWDATQSEAELHKASEDLLDGPDRFTQDSFQAPHKGLSSSVASADYHDHGEEIKDDKVDTPFSLPDPPTGCQRQPVSPSPIQDAQELRTPESKREESYKDAADAARAAALSAERAAAAAIAVASLAKGNFSRMPKDNISNRSMPESSSASDEDDYRDARIAPKHPPPTSDYFGIRMDSFDAHINRATLNSHNGQSGKSNSPNRQSDIARPINRAKSELPNGCAGITRPVFDEYPKDEPRYRRMQTMASRKQTVVADFASDEEESDSTERSASPPLQRGGRVEAHQDNRQASAYGSNFRQSSRVQMHINSHDDDNDDDNGFEAHQDNRKASAYGSNFRQSSRAQMHINSHDDDNGFEAHQDNRQASAYGSNFRQSSKAQIHINSHDDNGFYCHEAAGPPPKRPPPSVAQREQYSSYTAAHVHPKLPDYDDLSARFGALKTRN